MGCPCCWEIMIIIPWIPDYFPIAGSPEWFIPYLISPHRTTTTKTSRQYDRKIELPVNLIWVYSWATRQKINKVQVGTKCKTCLFYGGLNTSPMCTPGQSPQEPQTGTTSVLLSGWRADTARPQTDTGSVCVNPLPAPHRPRAPGLPSKSIPWIVR